MHSGPSADDLIFRILPIDVVIIEIEHHEIDGVLGKRERFERVATSDTFGFCAGELGERFLAASSLKLGRLPTPSPVPSARRRAR